MASVHWSLQVRGRLRPRTVLVDADGSDVARVVRDGRVQSMRSGGATDAEGRTWRVVGPPESLRVSCDGDPRATVLDGVLEVGDRSFGWRLTEDGSRTARVTSASGGGTLLRIDPGDGDAWARITFDDALPEPFAVVLAASIRLLEAEDPLWGPGRPGTGGRRGRVEPSSGVARSEGLGGRTEPSPDGAGGPAATPDGGARNAGGTWDADAPSRATGGTSPGALGNVGPPDETAPPAASWALFVQGRVRPRIVLADGGSDPLATLDLRGGPTGSIGRATDRDGRRWVAELDGGVVTMRCAGRAMARAEGQELTLGGRTLVWQASLEGRRTATATDADGHEVLRVEPGPGGDGPWVTVALDDALPSPLAATLATLFVLLRIDALGRRG